jgi:ADP-ribose pyrophosphatase YjhB (NUDIX family)
MVWSQKIYLNDKTLILTTDADAYISSNPSSSDYISYQGVTARNLNKAIGQLEYPGVPGVIITDSNEDAILKQLNTLFSFIDAAGGIAYNENGEILLIYRRGKWDLPKGKRDDDESMEECALREVKEETGLKNLQLDIFICNTYHIYSQFGEQMLKRTAWYKMTGTSKDKLKPQKEENILEARWVKEQDLGPFMKKTYEAIKEVLTVTGLRIA